MCFIPHRRLHFCKKKTTSKLKCIESAFNRALWMKNPMWFDCLNRLVSRPYGCNDRPGNLKGLNNMNLIFLNQDHIFVYWDWDITFCRRNFQYPLSSFCFLFTRDSVLNFPLNLHATGANRHLTLLNFSIPQTSPSFSKVLLYPISTWSHR